MHCYFCAQRHPGGTDYGVCSAIGICKHCGVGVCARHSQKPAEPRRNTPAMVLEGLVELPG